MENLQKDTLSVKSIKFRSNLIVILSLYLNIQAIISEISTFGYKTIGLYITFPACVILSYICSTIYFICTENILKGYKDIKPCWHSHYINLKDFKDKQALGNTYPFQSISLLWNIILGFGYTWFMIYENGHKWWIVLIGIIIDLIYAFFLLITYLSQRDLNRISKEIDKNLKEFEETNNVGV